MTKPVKIAIKQHLNHDRYIQTLRRMSPEKRLLKAFELSDFTKKLFIHGLHKQFPSLSREEFRKVLLQELLKSSLSERLQNATKTTSRKILRRKTKQP